MKLVKTLKHLVKTLHCRLVLVVQSLNHVILLDKIGKWFSIGVNFNPVHATVLFLCSLKTLENLWFSDVFRGYRMRPVPDPFYSFTVMV